MDYLISNRRKYQNKTIAILCPGKTSLEYNNDCDISVALNSGIKLDKKIDYFMAFDCKIPLLDYFTIKPEVTRILGANIYSMCPYSNTQGSTKKQIIRTLNINQELPPATEPHWYWYYKYDTDPSYKPYYKEFAACSTILIPALQLAVHWGCSQIYIYGASMNNSVYFYDTAKKHTYTDIGRRGVNNLIKSIDTHIPVYVKKEPDTKITAGRYF